MENSQDTKIKIETTQMLNSIALFFSVCGTDEKNKKKIIVNDHSILVCIFSYSLAHAQMQLSIVISHTAMGTKNNSNQQQKKNLYYSIFGNGAVLRSETAERSCLVVLKLPVYFFVYATHLGKICSLVLFRL